MNINNYNPEWLKAWDGNMDLAVCLDFFAIITYITDYYTKTETKMMDKLQAAAQACKDKDRKDQLKFLAQTFLTHREAGEMEIHYRVMPQLHLSESNLKCKFLATRFPHKRSRMAWKKRNKEPGYSDEQDNEEDSSQLRREVEIPGLEGKYCESISDHEKYAARPAPLQHMCLAQFVTAYDPLPEKEGEKLDFEDGVFGESYFKKNEKIVSCYPEYEQKLPTHIKLNKNLGYMRLRKTPSILRLYKIREDKDPHEFYYSKLLLYRPWSDEKELREDDLDECFYLFVEPPNVADSSGKSSIEITEGKLFKHRASVNEGRAVLETFGNSRPSHYGDELDPENEKANEEDAMEGLKDDENFADRFPEEYMYEQDDGNCTSYAPTSYGRINRPLNESQVLEMYKAVRNLDEDQRFALNILVDFVKSLRTCESSNMRTPTPPLLKIQGGAGAGKSTVIQTISQVCEYWMNFGNKDPRKPSVMKLAPTGKAAHVVQGLTLHSALHFPFGNLYTSLPDKLREKMRNDLSDLCILIVDEMSMVKSDMLYQLHLRLQEIKQSSLPFGGVAILFFGDMMQLKPVGGTWIFQPPRAANFRASHSLFPLWEEFKSIRLSHNHRQGGDKSYAEMLNRLRILPQQDEATLKAQKQLTSWERTNLDSRLSKEDKEMLRSRLCNKNRPPPDDAIYIFGRKNPAFARNAEKLAQLPGDTVTIKASHYCRFYSKAFKPEKDEHGFVGDTVLLDELSLKVGARVMLRTNLDTSDGLTNGAVGYVAAIEKKGEKVETIYVEFEDEDVGEKLRAKNKIRLSKLGIPNATPISRVSLEYRLGDKKKRHGAKAHVIQFPLTLAWALNAHKTQGITIKSPSKLVVDIDSCFGPAMVYVALSRVQNIEQLFLLSLDTSKIWASKEALEELEKMELMALNSAENLLNDNWNVDRSYALKITSLNIGHLPNRLMDLQNDSTILKSHIICLQETFSQSRTLPLLPGYVCQMSQEIDQGRGRGLVTFIKEELMDNFIETTARNEKFAQYQKSSFNHYDVISVYKTHDCKTVQDIQNFVSVLQELIIKGKTTIICGDFNFDYWKEKNNSVRAFMENQGFKQLVDLPTTVRGNCIDHVYISETTIKGKWKLHRTYFTDHEAVCVIIVPSVCFL